MPLLVALLLAAPAAHRAKAEHAEALGRMQEAAREYEAAFEAERAPDLLYRLGIVRRKLKQYGKAREAFRAYLREAPEGGLRDEVERQLAKLEVLIEAQSEDYSDPPTRPPPPARPPGGEHRSPPPAPNPESPSEIAPPAAPVVNSVNLGAAGSPRVVMAPAEPVPAAALVPAPLPAATQHAAVPWLAGASVALAAAGAYFWWDGSRLSRDLDARFAAGDLSPADHTSYSRARQASVAGRLLVLGGAALGATAVVLW